MSITPLVIPMASHRQLITTMKNILLLKRSATERVAKITSELYRNTTGLEMRNSSPPVPFLASVSMIMLRANAHTAQKHREL